MEHWRHEQLTLQMLLATYEHHAAPRRQSKARSREEESELNNATGQKIPPPRVASTVYFSLDGDGDVLAARPTPLVEVRPQPGVLRHTEAQFIETFSGGSAYDRFHFWVTAADCRADH